MAEHEYHVVSRWTVPGTVEDVADVFADPQALPHWWPAAFLSVELVRPGDARGVGLTTRVHTKGWLPYTLRFHSTVTAASYPHRFTLVVTGDFEGRCVANARARGSTVEIVFDWRVRVAKPVVRHLSWLLKRVFVANHLWVMARGHQSLALEMRRRRMRRRGLEDVVPLPPGPTFRYLARRRPMDRRAAHDFELYRRLLRGV